MWWFKWKLSGYGPDKLPIFIEDPAVDLRVAPPFLNLSLSQPGTYYIGAFGSFSTGGFVSRRVPWVQPGCVGDGRDGRDRGHGRGRSALSTSTGAGAGGKRSSGTSHAAPASGSGTGGVSESSTAPTTGGALSGTQTPPAKAKATPTPAHTPPPCPHSHPHPYPYQFQPFAVVIPFANGSHAPLPANFAGGHIILPPIPGDIRLALRAETLNTAGVPTEKSGCSIFGVGIFLDSLGAPHVRCTPVGRTCGEPNEIKLTPIWVELNGRRQAPHRVRRRDGQVRPLGSTPFQPPAARLAGQLHAREQVRRAVGG